VSYVVTTPSFSGPIELLLSLVSNHEVDVLEIELAPVVDAFVTEVVRAQGDLPLEQLSDFLLIAAILLEMKSRRLLPGPDDVESDEDFVGWEERDLLLARLLELRAYAAAADLFVGLLDQASRSWPRVSGLDDGFVVKPPDLLAGVTPERLAAAYDKATEEPPTTQVDLSHVTIYAVSVADTVTSLAKRLPSLGTTSFRKIVEGIDKRIEVIVHFLAVLELCKLGRVSLGQGQTFGDLEVAWLGDALDAGTIDAGDLEVDDYDG
jgi:segregation and condensation protein A